MPKLLLTKLNKLCRRRSINTLSLLSFHNFSSKSLLHRRCINTLNTHTKFIIKKNNSPINLLFISKFNCTNTQPNNKNNDESIIDRNTQRSTEHRREIIDNEYPDLNEVKHPYANINTPESHIPPPPEYPHTSEFYIDYSRPKFEDYVLPHMIWSEEEVNNVTITHKKPSRIADWLAFITVQLLRTGWDTATGYITGRKLRLHKFSSRMWLLRLVFLETTAGVPGMMFGMARHLHSLRKLQRDRGWIKTLLSEAENERIHLLTAMYLYKPGVTLRYAIVITQGIMCNFLFLSYLLSPRYCHSLVGYLEEQAVKTYTLLLKDIDDGLHPRFNEQASNLAKNYWKLPSNATWRDVFANMRADEANHRDVNHTLADLTDDPKALNPFRMHHDEREDYTQQ